MVQVKVIFPMQYAGCLAKPSSKSLRGSKMEDVIFGGTRPVRHSGFAQVQLTLDNSDGTLKDKG